MTRSTTLPPAGFHPLELIPYFRRFPCTRGRNLIYTFIWSMMFGAFFLAVNAAVAGRLPSWGTVKFFIVVSNFIGYAVHALFSAGELTGVEPWVRARGLFAKTVYFTLVPTLGVMAGFQATDWVFHIGFNWLGDPGWVISIAATSLAISLVISTIFFVREREANAAAELERERLRIERIERDAIAANLRALQAQIEPHFLFNTLANVASLVDRDPASAKHMLERFNHFLRASLAATRTESTTLGAERDLITAYLDVLKVRIGARLSYGIVIPADLESFALPPMLLQPVVENAIRHGLEPKVEGGRVDVTARREGGKIAIEIRDTGVGFASTASGGLGLTNLRERLKGLYGDAASLTIADNVPAGTVVTLHIPA